jgi:16S rRNA (adenine1518-N6/adenine1519-N6)-dimethyltransferase
MVDASLFERLADYALLDKGDVVLDVGAGLGFLTRFLADKCRSVLAVESDARLVGVLCEELRDLSNVMILEGDVLKVDVPLFGKVVSVPPYRISSRLLLWLFDREFDCGVLVFQKEFAERLVARIGSEEYGWLTVLAYWYVDVELLDEVSREKFFPSPNVDSVVVRLKPKKIPPFALKNEVLFRRLLQSLFVERNRKVKNAVRFFVKGRRGVDVKGLAEAVEGLPFRDRRVRELSPEDFGVLANVFAE